MKKIVLVSLAAVVCVFAQDYTKVGLGIAYMQQPYKETKSKVLAIPYLEVKYNGFYLRGIEAGYEQKIDDYFSVGAFTKGRLDGYKSSDSDYLNGMQERKYAVDVGAKVTFEKDKIGKISAFVLNDISGTYYGYELGIEYSRRYTYEKSILIPFISLKKESKKLTDYYYGIKKSEETLQRPEYSTNGAINTEIGIRHIYTISKDMELISVASYTKLDESIYNSPIVKDKEILKAFIACSYKFWNVDSDLTYTKKVI